MPADHSKVTLDVVRAAMALAQRDVDLELVTADQIQSLPRTRFATAERKQIAGLLRAQGKSNRKIAEELGVGRRTIDRDFDGRPNGPESGPNGPPKQSAENENGPGKSGSKDNDKANAAIEAKNARAIFILHCSTARELAAAYDGPTDAEIIRNCEAVIQAWTDLLHRLEKGGYHEQA